MSNRTKTRFQTWLRRLLSRSRRAAPSEVIEPSRDLGQVNDESPGTCGTVQPDSGKPSRPPGAANKTPSWANRVAQRADQALDWSAPPNSEGEAATQYAVQGGVRREVTDMVLGLDFGTSSAK